MMDSNMVVYIVVCAVMLFAAVLVSLDNIKTASELKKANTSIAELERIIEDIKRDRIQEKKLLLNRLDDRNQMCDRLRKENDRLKSICPVDGSVLVPLEKVTFGYDDYTLKVSFDIPDVIHGVNDEYTAELVGVLMSKEILVRKVKEVEE